MTITIKPAVIRELRTRNKFSRADLAHKSGVSERHIARIEGCETETMNVRNHTVNQLALALGVGKRMGVLRGDEPLPPAKRDISSETDLRLQFDLIEHRYGIKKKDLVALSPFLFTLLAEATIVWHRKQQKKFEACREEMKKIVPQPSRPVGIDQMIMLKKMVEEGRENMAKEEKEKAVNFLSTSFMHDMFDAAKEIDLSEVTEKTLFGKSDYKSKSYASTCNPFDEYIWQFFNKMKNDDQKIGGEGSKSDEQWDSIISRDIFDSWHSGNTGSATAPDAFLLLNAAFADAVGLDAVDFSFDLEPPSSGSDEAQKKRLAGEKSEDWLAICAIWNGIVRVRDIPKHLWEKGKETERTKWIAGQMPDDYEEKWWEGFHKAIEESEQSKSSNQGGTDE